jgi:hypothetical protein
MIRSNTLPCIRKCTGALPTIVALALLEACMAAAPAAPEKPAYQPNFRYAVADSGRKIDVTLGIIAPQYSGDGIEWWKRNKTDEISAALARSLRTSFTELFTAKGFNATGPFDSVDEMTFPEKKGCDFVLYPDFDVDIAMLTSGGMEAPQPKKEIKLFSLGSSQPTSSCTAKIVMSGTIQLTVKEPLSGEKIWIKKVDISQPDRLLEFADTDCIVADGTLRGARDAWAKANEDVYQNVMKSLDRYVSAELFKDFQKQSQELRIKKVYSTELVSLAWQQERRIR